MIPLTLIAVLLLYAGHVTLAMTPVHIEVTGGVFFLDVANRYQVFHKGTSCYFWTLSQNEASYAMTPRGTRTLEEEMTKALHHGVHVTPIDVTHFSHLASAIVTTCQDLHNYAVARPHALLGTAFGAA